LPGTFTQTVNTLVNSFTVDVGSLPVTGGPDLRVMPLQRIWPGFAINTIFYAAILWLLFAVPGFVCRRLVIRGRATRPVPCVCVSGWFKRCLHRVRQAGCAKGMSIE
jgi:hypothetical protein